MVPYKSTHCCRCWSKGAGERVGGGKRVGGGRGGGGRGEREEREWGLFERIRGVLVG